MSGRIISRYHHPNHHWRTVMVVVVVATFGWCNIIARVEADNTAAIIQFINSITLTGRTIATTGTTVEDKALNWLINENSPQYQFVPGSIINNTRLAQRYALATYYIDNARPKTEWPSNQSECMWIPVGCTASNNVTSLGNAIRGKANGTIPIDLGLLSTLRSVNWDVYGALPSSIGKWTELNTVRFQCLLSACITTLPASIGDWNNILNVELLDRGFIGSLPMTIGNWTYLRQIDVQQTSFNGTLPISIGNWPNVESVLLTNNQFSGSLPTSIERWSSSLLQFVASDNQFMGTVPESIGRWTRIETILLSNNGFSGSLPIGNWVNLTRYIVYNNNFTGTISPKVSNLSSIDILWLEGNNFTGTIPRSICTKNLSVLRADCPTKVACWCCDGCAAPNNLATSGILFRELRSDMQDGSWGPISIDIPGFDHVAMSFLDSVYESHPGYKNGPTYVSEDGLETRTIPIVNGVQNVHTLATFRHDSPLAGISPVINFRLIPIANTTALAMQNIITPIVQAAGFLDFNSIDEFVATHAPSAQKGGNGKFTGVGLVEWAAEQAGINNGQGFVPNEIESITTPNETFPLLSPELMYSALQNQGLVFSTQNYLKGYFDPVDHVLTDPIGRRTGVVNRTEYKEIPNAITSPKGDVETIVVVNPIAGEYVLKVYGIPGKKGIASAQVSGRPSITVRTNGDASIQEQSVVVPVVSGVRGDVNGDGAINQTDLDLLKSRIPEILTNFASTADMNGDGQLNQTDVDILMAYLVRPVKAPAQAPNRAPVATPPAGVPSVPALSPVLVPNRAPATAVPGSCPKSDKCSSGFMLHRTRLSRCIQRCTWNFLVRWRLKGNAWKCGKCQVQ